jgi:hypothetical protein
MIARGIRVGVVCCVAGGLFLIGWSAVRSQRQAPRKTNVPPMIVLQSGQKPKAPVREMPSSSMPELTVADVNNSMKARRDHAWATVKRVWEPVQIQGGQIPTWMTWYEQEDIQALYKEMLAQPQNQPKPPSREELRNKVAALLWKHPTKDLQTSLTSGRLGKTLRQFTFPAFHAIAPNAKPSAGMIYYNPAFVKHLLANAENIAKCNPSAPPRPADPNNLYAQCMDSEMPPDAVMIKTAWAPVTHEPDHYDSAKQVEVIKDVHFSDVFPRMVDKLSALPAGDWISAFSDEKPDPNEKIYGGLWAPGSVSDWCPPCLYSITDDTGQKWALLGMHIASKTLRTWQWTTLFSGEGAGWAWTIDMPESLHKQWPLPFGTDSFGMCTVSDFNEADPTPWAAYAGKNLPGSRGERMQDLSNTLKDIARVMQGRQWCANPFIEPKMSRGNCIGCHQGSPYSFLPTTLTKDRQTNAGDFGFSFDTNRANIVQIRNEFLLKEKIKLKP